MPARVLMLRGINIGGNRRVPMADLRALLDEAGYEDVRTYVQSGNVVLTSSASAARLERNARELDLRALRLRRARGRAHS